MNEANASSEKRTLAERVDDECSDLHIEADLANDEELGEEDSESLTCIRRLGLYRELMSEVEQLRAEIARMRRYG